MEFVGALIAIAISIFAWKRYQAKQRRAYLLIKYNDETVVERIMNKTIWEGMSQAQLVDSWGLPTAKDQKIYKTKTAETFKYNRTGKRRFAKRVIVENGIVVGWNLK